MVCHTSVAQRSRWSSRASQNGTPGVELEVGASTTGIKKLKNSLLWPLTKDQTIDLLGIIER
jgi:hypothetical protein